MSVGRGAGSAAGGEWAKVFSTAWHSTSIAPLNPAGRLTLKKPCFLNVFSGLFLLNYCLTDSLLDLRMFKPRLLRSHRSAGVEC
jgi:hypothetical protein